MKYETPVVAIEVLNTNDVVLVSGVKVEPKAALRSLTGISWLNSN